MDIKAAIKRVVRRLGYDIRAIHDDSGLGRDPLWDIRALTRAGEHPLILDVGANRGQSIDEFRRLFHAPVMHSFEPSPETFRQLQARWTHPDVVLNNVALGSRPDQRPFLENSHNDMSSFLALGPDGWGATEKRTTVPITTVDAYCAERQITAVDLLKIDTQGFELEVITGAEQMMARGAVHLVYLEIILSKMYDNLPGLDDIYRALTSRGFSLVSFYSFYYRDHRAAWTDALFVQPDYQPAVTRH